MASGARIVASGTRTVASECEEMVLAVIEKRLTGKQASSTMVPGPGAPGWQSVEKLLDGGVKVPESRVAATV